MGNKEGICTKYYEVKWEGPYKLEEVLAEEEVSRSNENKVLKSRGVYQIYGVHPVFGPNSLLYIGRVTEGSFSSRFYQHNSWLKDEPSSLNIYFGVLGNESGKAAEPEIDQIKRVEALLIYHTSPPYNSSGINTYHPQIEFEEVVVNLGNRGRIASSVSSRFLELQYRKDQLKLNWQAFEED